MIHLYVEDRGADDTLFVEDRGADDQGTKDQGALNNSRWKIWI